MQEVARIKGVEEVMQPIVGKLELARGLDRWVEVADLARLGGGVVQRVERAAIGGVEGGADRANGILRPKGMVAREGFGRKEETATEGDRKRRQNRGGS